LFEKIETLRWLFAKKRDFKTVFGILDHNGDISNESEEQKGDQRKLTYLKEDLHRSQV